MERSALEMVKVLLPCLLLSRPEAGAPLSLPLQLCPLTCSLTSLLNLYLFPCILVFPSQHGHQTLEHTGLPKHLTASPRTNAPVSPAGNSPGSLWTRPGAVDCPPFTVGHTRPLWVQCHTNIVLVSNIVSCSPKVTQSYAHDHTVTQLHAHCRRHDHIRSHVVTHMAKLFTRGLTVPHTLSITRPHGDTVSHTWWHRLTLLRSIAHGPTLFTRAVTRSHTRWQATSHAGPGAHPI